MFTLIPDDFSLAVWQKHGVARGSWAQLMAPGV
jgi:hypothetical protein